MDTQAVSYAGQYLYKRLIQAKWFIDKNYMNAINLSEISDAAILSKFHFTRLFKQIYGKTPHQYITYLRIEKAKQLLQESKSVSEVCDTIGFESLTTFSGLFKRMVGLTPSKFAEIHKKRKYIATKHPQAFIPACYTYMAGLIKYSNFEEVNIDANSADLQATNKRI